MKDVNSNFRVPHKIQPFVMSWNIHYWISSLVKYHIILWALSSCESGIDTSGVCEAPSLRQHISISMGSGSILLCLAGKDNICKFCPVISETTRGRQGSGWIRWMVVHKPSVQGLRWPGIETSFLFSTLPLMALKNFPEIIELLCMAILFWHVKSKGQKHK